MDDIKNKLKLFINNNLVDEVKKTKLVNNISIFKDEESVNINNKSSFYKIKKTNKNSNIEDYFNKHNQYSDFQTMLFKLIDDRNLKDSDVYNKVHIDRRLFSKIRSDNNYHPSKETIILLAIALELTEYELDELLNSASYSLPKNNKYDLIIRFCFINKIFKISDINELLHEYNYKLFNY